MQGRSLREIAEELDISLSTASVWARGVEMTSVSPASSPLEARPIDSGDLKICPRCMRILPEDAFNRSKEGRQGWCRECFSGYFEERGRLHLDQTRAAKQKRVAAARAMIESHLATHPCADCGLEDSDVLEFDHIGCKRDDITTLSWNGSSLNLLGEELRHCEVVC
jgi:hypothetical protein